MTNEQLVTSIKAGEDVAGNMARLWEQTQHFIHTMAVRYQGQAEIEDLEQEGYIALYAAIRGYNPAAGCLFLTYARHWIQMYMIRYIQNNGSIRIPVHEWERLQKYKKLENAFLTQTGRKPSDRETAYYLHITMKQVRSLKENLRIGQLDSLDKCLREDGESTIGDMVPGQENVEEAVLDGVEAVELQAAIWSEVEALPEQLAEVIRARYQRGETLRDIGTDMGVTPERVRQIESQAMRELRKPHRVRMLRPFLPEAVESQAYRHNGVEEFKRTWTSSTELAAMMLPL
ncbi:sigma-70 family RNA polymerase sigma factor [Eisenbergiella tayi]|uniref:sigma-70 family RNA polymerase sigma factor n=1 Tax=Eisenbergiella tayi TaxID=1432052 RepID=UPI00084882D8|nr:sigma-70 family RNA polymerase sigma factor [Eisenbergiella tayi]ODR41298.1 hypothetical protein BEI60_06300 [Eisenbergiella tayi]